MNKKLSDDLWQLAGLIALLTIVFQIAVYVFEDKVYNLGSNNVKILDFSLKGFSCKTWEGQTDEGLYFSVFDHHIVDAIKSKMHNGENALLWYEKRIIIDPCTHSTKYVIIGVE